MTHPTCCYYKETVLRRIVVNDFLTLQNGVEMNCVPGVNVIIGENGTGKSTLMKLIYAVRTSFDTEVYGMEHGQMSLFVPFRDKNYDGVEHLPLRACLVSSYNNPNKRHGYQLQSVMSQPFTIFPKASAFIQPSK